MTEADLLEASLGDYRVLARPGPAHNGDNHCGFSIPWPPRFGTPLAPG